MARPFVLEIHESAEFLHRSLLHANTAAQKERLQMLWWVATGQVTQQQELAHRLGHSVSTISRWIRRYREGGLDALLERRTAPGKPPAIQGQLLEDLKAELAREDCPFSSYIDIQRWLEERTGHAWNYVTVRKTVRYKLGAKLKRPRPRNAKQHPESIPRFQKTSDGPLLRCRSTSTAGSAVATSARTRCA